MFANFWNGLARGARWGLASGCILIVLLTAIGGYYLLRTEYQVLFANLTPQDADAMVTELERLKVPFELGEGGTSILVARDIVYKTRIKLMGKEDLLLHGTVGFELFNNADFGMTEFAQKVNFQRALQGEITRSILAADEIESARVLLAMPDDGLFKRANSRSKASITLTMKRGQVLRREQVNGIQRLVAAAVPNIRAQDVTIVDQHGVALTRLAQGGADGDSGVQELDLKRETEAYLSRKADAVLARIFGEGKAMASVDVTLDMDQVHITSEDVVTPPVPAGKDATGVLVHERETIHDGAGGGVGRGAEAAGSSQRESEYKVGRRVEQVVGTPGSVRVLHVVAVVPTVLDPEMLEQARQAVFASVGGSLQRGDVVVLQTAAVGAPVVAGIPEPAVAAMPAAAATPAKAITPAALASIRVVQVLLALLVVAAAAAYFSMRRSRRRVGIAVLSDRERQAALAQAKAWLASPAGAPAAMSERSSAKVRP